MTVDESHNNPNVHNSTTLQVLYFILYCERDFKIILQL